MQPKIFNAHSLIVWSRKKSKKLQIVENKVWRQILGEPVFTLVAALYRKIRVSTVERRDRKIKLRFGLYMSRTSNGIWKAIFGRMSRESKPRRWMRQLREFKGEMELSFDRLQNMTMLE